MNDFTDIFIEYDEQEGVMDFNETKSAMIQGDDGGYLEVIMTVDSDMHIHIIKQPEEITNAIRFRTYFGGGHPEGVRLALKQLMIAIQNDPKCLR